MVQPLVFYDGVRVLNGPNDEDPYEEEEDTIASGLTVLRVGDDPAGIQGEQRHSVMKISGSEKRRMVILSCLPVRLYATAAAGRILLRTCQAKECCGGYREINERRRS